MVGDDENSWDGCAKRRRCMGSGSSYVSFDIVLVVN